MASKDMLTSPSPPSNEPGTVLLKTKNLIIRRLLLSDAPALAAAANHKSIATYMRNRFPSPYTLSDAENFITTSGNSTESYYPGHVAIFTNSLEDNDSSNKPLFIGGGAMMLRDDSMYYRTWEVGYWLTPSAQGKGYATEFTEAFVRWSFETWPELNRVEAFVLNRNLGSLRVLQKCGFVKEGIRRGAAEKHGEMLDEVILALLRKDLGGITVS